MLMPHRELELTKQFEQTSKDHLLRAKRFVLDHEATRYLGEMIRDVPRIIADAQDFAIPPFHTMWIEFPFATLWNTVNPNPMPGQIGGPTDKRIGFLIIGNQVRVAVQGQAPSDPVWCPVEYMLNYPMSERDQLNFCEKYGLSRLSLDHFFWGSSLFKFMQEDKEVRFDDENSATVLKMMKKDMAIKLNVNEDGSGNFEMRTTPYEPADREANRQSLRALRTSHGVRVIDMPGYDPKEFFHYAVAQSAGDLRNLIALLLFLNRTSDLRADVEVGPKQQMVRNKLRPLLKHTVIRIKLNPTPRFKKMVAGEGQWRRLHDVRGHFCHNERARTSNCMHPEWEETKPLHWVCTSCKGAKWWRHEHKRGHEEKGIVTSEYNVTK